MGPLATLMPVLTGLGTVLSVATSAKQLFAKEPETPQFEAPAAAEPGEDAALQTPTSGGVDSLASGLARRRITQRLQSDSGAKSNVLSAGSGTSLGAGAR